MAMMGRVFEERFKDGDNRLEFIGGGKEGMDLARNTMTKIENCIDLKVAVIEDTSIAEHILRGRLFSKCFTC